MARKAAAEIKRLRDAHLRVHVDAMLAWAASEYDRVRDLRGPMRSALGYIVRQKDALARFLDDGRLRLDNNPSELQLRSRVVLGRKASLFVGSDGHAESAAGIMSLVASARLHGLDPEAYLRDMIRVLPHWPSDRYLALAPMYWAATRARLDAAQLAAELGGPPPRTSRPRRKSNRSLADLVALVLTRAASPTPGRHDNHRSVQQIRRPARGGDGGSGVGVATWKQLGTVATGIWPFALAAALKARPADDLLAAAEMLG